MQGERIRRAARVGITYRSRIQRMDVCSMPEIGDLVPKHWCERMQAQAQTARHRAGEGSQVRVAASMRVWIGRFPEVQPSPIGLVMAVHGKRSSEARGRFAETCHRASHDVYSCTTYFLLSSTHGVGSCRLECGDEIG